MEDIVVFSRVIFDFLMVSNCYLHIYTSVELSIRRHRTSDFDTKKERYFFFSDSFHISKVNQSMTDKTDDTPKSPSSVCNK